MCLKQVVESLLQVLWFFSFLPYILAPLSLLSSETHKDDYVRLQIGVVFTSIHFLLHIGLHLELLSTSVSA